MNHCEICAPPAILDLEDPTRETVHNATHFPLDPIKSRSDCRTCALLRDVIQKCGQTPESAGTEGVGVWQYGKSLTVCLPGGSIQVYMSKGN
jgi:hypothetical protein